MYVQNVTWPFQIQRELCVILQKPINQRENLNAILVVLEIKKIQTSKLISQISDNLETLILKKRLLLIFVIKFDHFFYH